MKIDNTFVADDFLEDFGLYVSRVQDEVHARRGRVAMFWSLVSLLYVFGWMEVDESLQFAAFGISFPGLNILLVLCAITTYYAVRFGFSVAKIVVVVNPFVLRRDLRNYKKLEEIGFDFESLGYDIKYYEQVKEYGELHDWNVGENSLKEKYPSYAEEQEKRAEEEWRRNSILSPMRMGNFNPPPDFGIGSISAPLKKHATDVRHHNLRHPKLGYWENFFFLMYFPIGVCFCALLALVWEISAETGIPFTVHILMPLTVLAAQYAENREFNPTQETEDV